jgi:hypothetical protein
MITGEDILEGFVASRLLLASSLRRTYSAAIEGEADTLGLTGSVAELKKIG